MAAAIPISDWYGGLHTCHTASGATVTETYGKHYETMMKLGSCYCSDQQYHTQQDYGIILTIIASPMIVVPKQFVVVLVNTNQLPHNVTR